MTSEDFTNPISESYLHLSEDQDIDELSDGSVNMTPINNTRLMHLVKQFDEAGNINEKVIDNNNNSINDDTEIQIVDLDNDILRNMHSTPLIPKYKSKPKHKQTLTIDELAQLIQPLFKEELKEFKENIKDLLIQNDSIKKADLVSDDDELVILETQSEPGFQESPITTPPTSSDANKNDFTFRSSDQEIQFLKQQIKDLTTFNNELKLQNTRLLKESEVDELKMLNNQLILKLNDSKLYNQELRNEINYCKSNKDKRIAQLSKEINDLNNEIGDKTKLITIDSIQKKEFITFYTKLNCDKVDSLTKVEMSNLIKNLLLTLLIDFETLPDDLIKFSMFFKVANKFLDRIHALVYDNTLRPSYYYINNLENALDNFETCLNGLSDLLKQLVDKNSDP